MPALLSGGKLVEILLVEDNETEAEMTMETLREGRLRNHVHWVEDGEQAMEFLRREGTYADAPRPDLILLDLEMPRMGGLEVLAEIKQHPEWRRIPVVIMTSSSDERHVLGAYNRHANCYITKPVDLDKFMEAVRSVEDFWLTLVRLPAA
jgi:chemotaxis family two-component system response regulator Rcp1